MSDQSSIHGIVYWSELMTRDIPSALGYYRSICGWTFDAMPMDGGATYHVAKIGDKPVAGLMDLNDMEELNEVPPHWFTYIAVDDVDAAVIATQAAGGTLNRPAFDIPGTGRIAIITDPTGAVVGLMTPEEMGAPDCP